MQLIRPHLTILRKFPPLLLTEEIIKSIILIINNNYSAATAIITYMTEKGLQIRCRLGKESKLLSKTFAVPFLLKKTRKKKITEGHSK